jgi:hypothetical protein
VRALRLQAGPAIVLAPGSSRPAAMVCTISTLLLVGRSRIRPDRVAHRSTTCVSLPPHLLDSSASSAGLVAAWPSSLQGHGHRLQRRDVLGLRKLSQSALNETHHILHARAGGGTVLPLKGRIAYTSDVADRKRICALVLALHPAQEGV